MSSVKVKSVRVMHFVGGFVSMVDVDEYRSVDEVAKKINDGRIKSLSECFCCSAITEVNFNGRFYEIYVNRESIDMGHPSHKIFWELSETEGELTEFLGELNDDNQDEFDALLNEITAVAKSHFQSAGLS